MSGPSSPLLKLFLAERKRLVRLIDRIVGCRDTAEDLAQDTFLRLCGRPVTDSDRNLLLRTGQNLAFDHLRARHVRLAFAEAAPLEQNGLQVAPQEREACAREDLAGLLDALQALPRRTQQSFLLNRLDGLPYAEIAKTLGVSISTVEKDIIRALRTIRLWRNRQDWR